MHTKVVSEVRISLAIKENILKQSIKICLHLHALFVYNLEQMNSYPLKRTEALYSSRVCSVDVRLREFLNVRIFFAYIMSNALLVYSQEMGNIFTHFRAELGLIFIKRGFA